MECPGEHRVEGESRRVIASRAVRVLLVHPQVDPAGEEADDTLEEGLEHREEAKEQREAQDYQRELVHREFQGSAEALFLIGVKLFERDCKADEHRCEAAKVVLEAHNRRRGAHKYEDEATDEVRKPPDDRCELQKLCASPYVLEKVPNKDEKERV